MARKVDLIIEELEVKFRILGELKEAMEGERGRGDSRDLLARQMEGLKSRATLGKEPHGKGMTDIGWLVWCRNTTKSRRSVGPTNTWRTRWGFTSSSWICRERSGS